MSNYDFDLIIIGAGPGGYVAGIRASQLGLKTAIIEKDQPGGVCLNIGCIPSKSLIHQAGVFQNMVTLEKYGIKCDTSGFDYSRVFRKSRESADRLSQGVMFLLKKNNIEYIQGEARIMGEHEITTGDKKYTGKNIIIATGSRPRQIPGFEFDEDKVLSSNGILMMDQLPKSLIILGAGAIGMEFAYIMNGFGVGVTVVELLDRILPMEDGEVSETIMRLFKRKKIKFHTGTRAKGIEKGEKGIKLTVEDSKGEKVLEAEKLLVSVGRAPNTENIGLETVAIETQGGFIPVEDYYQTKIPGIFAIGDVINTPQLAHVASKEGEIAVEYIAGRKPKPQIDPLEIPSAVYCEPQVGSFGWTEEKLKEKESPYEKAVFPYRAIGKAVASEESDGFVKVLYNRDIKEILGAHIVGSSATDLIHEILLAKKSELLPEDIAEMIHAHPTLSEGIMEAMRMAEGWAIHV